MTRDMPAPMRRCWCRCADGMTWPWVPPGGRFIAAVTGGFAGGSARRDATPAPPSAPADFGPNNAYRRLWCGRFHATTRLIRQRAGGQAAAGVTPGDDRSRSAQAGTHTGAGLSRMRPARRLPCGGRIATASCGRAALDRNLRRTGRPQRPRTGRCSAPLEELSWCNAPPGHVTRVVELLRQACRRAGQRSRPRAGSAAVSRRPHPGARCRDERGAIAVRSLIGGRKA